MMSTQRQELAYARKHCVFNALTPLTFVVLLIVPFLSSLNVAGAERCDLKHADNAGFIPERRAEKGVWSAEIENPSKRIILAAGHVNRITGTAGYNNHPMVTFQGHEHTTEAIITKVVVPLMVETGIERGFVVEQFTSVSDNFKQAVLDLAYYEKLTQGIAFEIHTDVPSEGHHRAPGYDGQTGVIPAANNTISHAEACVGNYMGKFKRGLRNLFAPRQGISILELFPTNRKVTEAIHHGVATGDFEQFKQLSKPYINLFYDALLQAGIHPSHQ